jgi:hypothetical protein
LDRDPKWIGDALHLRQHAGGFNCEKQVRRLTSLPIEAKLAGMLDKMSSQDRQRHPTPVVPKSLFRRRGLHRTGSFQRVGAGSDVRPDGRTPARSYRSRASQPAGKKPVKR